MAQLILSSPYCSPGDQRAVLGTGGHSRSNQCKPGRQGLWHSSWLLPPSTAGMKQFAFEGDMEQKAQ